MRAALSLAVFVIAASPQPARAWGFEAHKVIMSRAIDQLPPALKAFFEPVRPFMIERSTDPDLWRLAGWTDEPPRHFLDVDAYPGADPPREYDRAVERFGAAEVRQNGVLPWRVEEMYGQLQRAFHDIGRGDYGVSDARFYAAILCHYVADAHVPFHAVVNHDGQFTGQRGIHARFETELFERYRDRLRIVPPAMRPVRDIRAFAFDALVESSRLVPRVLEADRQAASGRTTYDDAYFARFFAGAGPVLERRLSDSVAAVAAAITGAWQAAGAPALPAAQPHRVKPIPTPGNR